MEEKYFKIAIDEAKKAYKHDEIPVGAIIVKNNKIISKACNKRQRFYNPLGHAEIISILKACKKNKDWRLDNYIMYVTLEPCEMCQTIIKECRLQNVVFLVSKPNSILNSNKFTQTNDCVELKKEYTQLLNSFFKKLR